MGVYGKNIKMHNRTRLFILNKDYMLEGVPVQAELVDVVIFFKLQLNLDKWGTLSLVPTVPLIEVQGINCWGVPLAFNRVLTVTL